MKQQINHFGKLESYFVQLTTTMHKSLLSIALAALAYMPIRAGETNTAIIGKPKFSGYIIGQYQANFQGSNSNTFSLRMARVSVGGRILGDFEYKVQGQINGNTSTLGESPRVVDLFVEWQRYSFARIKVGQFKRPFTFENPMHPVDQGFMGYSQNVQRLSGFNDRTGEQASNGRDIGIQIQGDLLPNSSGRALVHYQIGVFNGQGINSKDADNRKDIIGGAWVMPAKGLRIGVFGWTGSHARDGHWTDGDGKEHNGTVSLSQYRYAVSAEYKDEDWQLRSEYIHSTGYGFKTTKQDSGDAADATVNYAQGNKADGIYALCIAPIIRQKLRAKARYDLYRKSGAWTDSRTQYEIGLNYLFSKNLEVQAEYAFINDRSLAEHNYSMVDVELSVRF